MPRLSAFRSLPAIRRLSAGVLTLCMGLAAATLPVAGAAAEKAPMKGVGDFEIPEWFKLSFLDLEADVAEAASADKRLILFFYQDGCPYCEKTLEYNFSQKPIRDYTQSHFDIVALNMWGDRPVTDLQGNETTEKQLAQQRKVWFTPTILMLDEQGEVALRINGYYPPDQFLTALRYVGERKEDEIKFSQYMKEHGLPKAAGEMHEEPFFAKPPHDLAKIDKPIAVFFEQPQCIKCDELHDDVLDAAKTREHLDDFHVVQLNRWADTPVVTPDGRETTARQWADSLEVSYVPTAVFFDQGEEVIRSEAFFKAFHTQSMMAFVTTGAYKEYDNFQRYVHDRSNELREQGVTVDLWE